MLTLVEGTDAEDLLALAAARIPDTAAHGERVGRFSVAIARALGIGRQDTATIGLAARFHDIGKLAIPVALIEKPGPLTDEEQEIMRRHVNIGAELLAQTRTLAPLAPLVLASHERFDGCGYPFGLSGRAIPIGSRIIAVADTYDAMTQGRRSYRECAARETAIIELREAAGRQFDAMIVDAFLTILAKH
jgi:HD-GYP domain-containing protein (c-di-GMP phosphodiesterase class II)